MVVRADPRSRLSSRTPAPVTAAAIRSATSPETVAVSVCPPTPQGNQKIMNNDGPTTRRKRGSVIIEWTPLVYVVAAIHEKFAIENSNHFDLSETSWKDNHWRFFVVEEDWPAESKLRMVWLVSPVGVKNFLSVRFVVLFAANFGCYKH